MAVMLCGALGGKEATQRDFGSQAYCWSCRPMYEDYRLLERVRYWVCTGQGRLVGRVTADVDRSLDVRWAGLVKSFKACDQAAQHNAASVWGEGKGWFDVTRKDGFENLGGRAADERTVMCCAMLRRLRRQKKIQARRRASLQIPAQLRTTTCTTQSLRSSKHEGAGRDSAGQLWMWMVQRCASGSREAKLLCKMDIQLQHTATRWMVVLSMACTQLLRGRELL